MPFDPSFATLIVVLALAGVALWASARVQRRLEAVERSLEKLEAVDDLAARVQAFGEQLERHELPRQLQARLTEFVEGQARLAAAVRELRTAAPPAATPVVEDVDTIVRRQLESRGFERVRLLTDVEELRDGAGRLTFEAYRHGALHKGSVTVRSGVIVDENVRPAYAAFP